MRVACFLVTGHFGRYTYLLPLDLIHHLIVRVPCQMSDILILPRPLDLIHHHIVRIPCQMSNIVILPRPNAILHIWPKSITWTVDSATLNFVKLKLQQFDYTFAALTAISFHQLSPSSRLSFAY